jgi:hypothetical protein
MWNGGGHPNDDPSQRGPDDNGHSRLTASALAAYATSGGAAASGYSNPMGSYPPPPGAYHHLDPATAAAAAQLRHQEQMRQQALLAQLQQHHPGVYHPHHAAAMDEMEYARQLAAARQQQEEMTMQRLWEAEHRRSFSAGQEPAMLPREILSKASQPVVASSEHASADVMPSGSDEDMEETSPVNAPPPPTKSRTEEATSQMTASASPAPRGKPEAIAKALAAARIHEKIEELQAEQDVEAVAEPVEEEEEDEEDYDEEVDVKVEEDVAPAEVVTDETPKPKPKKPRKKPVATAKKPKAETIALTVDDPYPKITDVEYECLEGLMEKFCRVPLLAEFSRPVAILHPEVGNVFAPACVFGLRSRHSIFLVFFCHVSLNSLFHSCFQFILKLFTTPSTWEQFAEPFAGGSTKIQEQFVWICGVFLPTA